MSEPFDTTHRRDHRQRLQQVLVQAQQAGAPRYADTAEALEAARLLQRIEAQRLRLGTQRSLRAQARAQRPTWAFAPQALAKNAWADARGVAMRHPIATGLALGAALALGPRRLRRLVFWAAPLAWRGWRMVDRARGWFSDTRR